MASPLPPIPRFIFMVLEPISLLAGGLTALAAPEWFVAEQIMSSNKDFLSENNVVVTLQLGNMYLLLALMAVLILSTTTEPKVVRNYIIALWVADIGHVGATCYFLGFDRFTKVSEWNAMTFGNIAATAFLNLCRTLYLFGMFGPIDGHKQLAKDRKIK